jgi:chromate transporter
MNNPQDVDVPAGTQANDEASLSRLPEVCSVFLRLGLTSFGGPVAHLGYFQRECVDRRRWLDDAAYADLVALCQFLPGPASSQVVFSLGMRRAGLAGALGGSLCFMLPSAVAMICLAYGVEQVGGLSRSGWLHGLKLAAVAVVALAVWTMARKLCTDWLRRAMAACAACAVVLWPGPIAQVGAIAACALVSWWIGGASAKGGEPGPGIGRGHLWAVASLAAFALLLGVLPLMAGAQGGRVAVFDGFYRAGALVFGGGHVVLPLLRAEVVPRGWVGDDAFLAGYGAAQALPGPLFTFAAYLGTLIGSGSHAWATGVLALFAIFLPGWLIVGGAYPFWHVLRGRGWARAALGGANAAVVGILLAALYQPMCTEGIRDARDVAAVTAGIILLALARLPSWAVVAAMGAAGHWILH